MADSKPPLMPQLVFVPNLRVDRGMGHLRRCLAAAAVAGNQAAVYLARSREFSEGFAVFDELAVRTLAQQSGARLIEEWPENLVFRTVVADLQATSLPGFAFLRSRSFHLLGWDEGGKARDRYPFLVDSLPHDTKPEPNLRLAALLGLVRSSSQFDRPIKRVLVAFGGADPQGLTLRFLTLVEQLKGLGRWSYDLTVVRGPLASFILPVGVEVIEAPRSLAVVIPEFDLLVTSWGLTALEALAAGVPVILLNPSSYHEHLTRSAGLPSIGVKQPRTAEFFAAVEEAPAAARRAAEVLLQEPLSAGAWFLEHSGSDGRCPVCHRSGNPVFARTEHKSFHRCLDCKMEYLSTHRLPEKQYSEAYFFEDYERQYGKTYLQDFPHIQSMGRQRLLFLDQHCGKRSGRRILDVGCAYGPFLAAVHDAGYHPFGVDIAQAAVEHVQKNLGFPAVAGSFLEFDWSTSFPGEPLPDVLTMWYVIEHFPDLEAVLVKAHHLLEPGSIFAFSTPNGKGITGRFQPFKFWKESPDDHFSIWSPRIAARVLKRFGFELVAVRVTGHHPERFPGVKSAQDWRFPVISVLSHWFGWGDTFEVYARKVRGSK